MRALPDAGTRLRQGLSSDDWTLRAGILVILAYLTVTLLLPMSALLSKALEDRSGAFVGLQNFARYFATPSLSNSIGNSLFVGLVSTAICVSLAFVYAYGLTRTLMPGRAVFRLLGAIPLLVPSLLPAIALVYMFGNQGYASGLLMGESIYGPIGIIIGSVFWTFPHALIILITALSLSDARLYEASEALGASPWRTFWTVTISGARYGILSAIFVVFTLVVTDFGVPKVIGGQFNVLATDVYKQVVGQQNFEMGAVVGLVLLLPAVLSFLVDRIVQSRQGVQLTGRSIPYAPKANRKVDLALGGACLLIGLAIVSVLGTAFFAAFAKLWPYDLSFSLRHFDFDNMDGGGWASYVNSLRMAGLTAVFGTAIIFTGAYLVEKTRGFRAGREAVHFLALLPMAVPGLVLGLGYIFFFNAPGNPLNFIYGTMAILVLCTIAHFYSVAHLTAVTALKQLDPEFETVSQSLRVPVRRTFLAVTVPVSLPAIRDVAIYLFVNAMTTVSAVVFLYSPATSLASVAALNMDDAGDIAPAAAMGVLIFCTAALVRVIYTVLTAGLLRATQRWRHR